MTNEKVIECLRLLTNKDDSRSFSDEEIKKITSNPIVFEGYREMFEAYEIAITNINEEPINLLENIKTIKLK